MVRNYASWADFERDEIRPCFRIGFSIDELEDYALDRTKYDDVDIDDLFEMVEFGEH